MKEGGDGSSERRRPHGSTRVYGRSIIPDWASLPPELLEGIADRVLSTTGGVDAYMDMRAVCSTWRSAIAKPSPLAAVTDLRFRPRNWIMVDLKSKDHDDDACLFLHVPTGRFRRRRLPLLRNNILVSATDGLLVLRDRLPPYLARVLNPFTGDMLHFAAPLPEHITKSLGNTSVNGGSHSTLVFLTRTGMVLSAAPTSVVFTEKVFDTYLNCIVNFQGDLYCADSNGCVFKFVTPADQCDDELVVIAQVSPDVDVHTYEDGVGPFRSFLVESVGELLLVRYVDHFLKVFRVDVERKLMEEVKSLSGRTLFIGKDRCVSLDADKFPSVDGDCIYMSDIQGSCDMCVYNLRGDMVGIISSENFFYRPFSLVQVLLRYCGIRY